MKIKSLLLIGSMAVFGMAMTSCSKEENLFDSDAAQAKRMDTYKANFEKKYGKIDPNQSWDFSTMQRYGVPTGFDASVRTRGIASESVITRSSGTMEIEESIIDWMDLNMMPGNNNSSMGKGFSLTIPHNSFTIVPIFQGNASLYWQLFMSVEGQDEDILIWSKGEDLSYTLKDNPTDADWIKCGIGQKEGVSKDAKAVKAPTFTFDLPAGKKMFFYLATWKSKSACQSGKQPTILTSLDQQMLALESAPIPANVPAGNTVTIIGCEDQAITGGDHDYEDLVFLMYGNPVPPISYEVDKDIVLGKRYMIEDLGGDDDFDFNDIVIDVQKIYTEVYYYQQYAGEAPIPCGTDVIGYKEQAVLRAAGGTKDFTITIGSTSWSKSDKFSDFTEMLNTGWEGAPMNYKAELAIIPLKDGDWDAENNNISVSIKDSNSPIKSIHFPTEGTAPMMIAEDPTAFTKWMKERVSIPGKWKNWVE